MIEVPWHYATVKKFAQRHDLDISTDVLGKPIYDYVVINIDPTRQKMLDKL